MRPGVGSIAENMPAIPDDAYDSDIQLVHPWSIVHGYVNGTDFTNETLFYYNYHLSSKYYEKTLNIENLGTINWRNVTWFIGFPENRTIDYNSVRIKDLNNGVFLTAG